MKEIEKEIRKDIEENTEKAKAAPVPELKKLYEDIYIDKPYFVRAVEKDHSVIVQ
jgi:TPP-dependent pyruvate/acetoin dehydrogenase alpha subunit